MRGWGAPLVASAFWAGLLLWDIRPASATTWPWWVWVVLGCVALAGAIAAAPRRRGDDPIDRAGLSGGAPPAVAAVASTPTDPSRSPLKAIALVVLGAILCGVGWAGLGALRAEHSLLHRLAPRTVTLLATLREDPEPSAFGWYAIVDVSDVSWAGGAATLRETTWVSGNDAPPAAVRGDQLLIEGTLQIPDDAGFAATLAHRGLAVSVRAIEVQRVGGFPSPFVRMTQVVRAFVGTTIERIFPPREAGLLLGLVLGDASKLDPVTTRDFQTVGLGHLLVVSGENVAMVLAPVMAFAGALKIGPVGRFAMGMGVVVLFVVLTGAEPSVLRAGTMACLALLGVLLGKPRTTGTILAAAVLALLILDPWLVHAIGFQLSVAATAGMVVLATPIAERLGGLMPSPVALAAGTTIAAQLGVTPLLLFHFHEVPGITIVANLAAFPAVSPALLLGIAASGLGLIWLPLGNVAALLARVPMRYLEVVASALAKAPVAWVTSSGSPLVLVAGVTVFVAIAAWLRSGWRPPRRAMVVGFALAPVLMWQIALGAGPPSGLTVRILDIGQGDSILISSPAGATVLIDGGPDDELDAQLLVSYGVKRLDAVVASHPHADHIGGLPQVLARFPVGVFLEPGCPDDTALQADLHEEIDAEGIPVRMPRAGDTVTVGDLTFDVLSPDRCWDGSHSDPNNDSLVLLLNDGPDSMLFTGDAEREAQQVLLDTDRLQEVDVLKMPHHAGDTSLPDFFPAVSPEVVAISVGQPNPYGHPNPNALAEAASTGADIWRTDEHGTLTITWDEEGKPIVTPER
ncbi:MAG TPA: DNA internalization-related competence protein ComEC/Rec2 [Actinomycetota bacterium]|nr:DNA internalization-related competence protein ComEC/Rec2 [Actinomycetota bacterium]